MNEDYKILAYFYQITEQGGPTKFMLFDKSQNYPKKLELNEEIFRLKIRSFHQDGFIEDKDNMGFFNLSREGREKAKEYLDFIEKEKRGFWRNNKDYLLEEWNKNKHKSLWWILLGIGSFLTFIFGKYSDYLFDILLRISNYLRS